MAKINIKQFCKEFKAYEEKVGKTAAWRGVLSEVGNAAKNESTRSFDAPGVSPFGEAWKPLSPATLKKKKGSLKLVESGHLKRSLRSNISTSEKRVSVGSNLEYAAIHQFGGRAGRGHKVNIPARPFLPINERDEISPSLERQINAVLNRFLEF